jgi:hypothetical protein
VRLSWKPIAPLALLPLTLLAATGCGQRYWVCDPPDPQRLAQLPPLLSATGLFQPGAAISPDVWPYRPRFALWSDGADKRRWIRLPPGTSIDTSDMNNWRFPAGTKLWKEFSRNGIRVETRLLEKIGPADEDWVAEAYLWRPDQTDAVADPEGAIDALGTPHDVPAAAECMGCHGGRRSRVLGFSAIQLSAPGQPGDLDLIGATRAGWLSRPPAGNFEPPGDATTRDALGYLHANCSHCHNQQRPPASGARCYDPKTAIDFSLDVDHLSSTAETATHRTVVGSAITRGQPDASKVIEMVSHRGFFGQMPPLATNDVDESAVQVLRKWIAEMGATP